MLLEEREWEEFYRLAEVMPENEHRLICNSCKQPPFKFQTDEGRTAYWVIAPSLEDTSYLMSNGKGAFKVYNNFLQPKDKTIEKESGKEELYLCIVCACPDEK